MVHLHCPLISKEAVIHLDHLLDPAVVWFNVEIPGTCPATVLIIRMKDSETHSVLQGSCVRHISAHSSGLIMGSSDDSPC